MPLPEKMQPANLPQYNIGSNKEKGNALAADGV